MRKSAVAVAVGLAFATNGGRVLALPEGGQVTAGQGSIGTPANGSLTVTQQSNRMAIDWQRFGIRTGESVHFAQPSASAIALNRVIGNEASQIYGRLSANGQVFLLNPNGVLFAPGSQVNVGGLVASTLKMSNEDFLAGRYVFSKGEKAGSVVNQGEITAGYAALLGPQVSNEGLITATLGTVALAAGEQITLNLNGTSLVGLTVDKGALDALAANRHLIRADGGTVILTAKATDDILRNVVNNDGIIEARSISQRDGVIRLESTGSGITAVNGELTAKNITVTGDKVGLFDNARLSAPSGTILVGGNFQGKGPERNSSATYVAPGAVLNADGAGDSDGGRVIVWSDGITAFYGHLSARGGPRGGDGGFAEISGKESLIVKGSIDLTAPHGRPGSVLFDPKNIIIEDGGLGLLSDAQLFGTVPGNNVSIDADVITFVTNSGVAVTLQASNNITVDEAVITNNASGNGGNLTFQAGHSILVNADIVTDNGNLTLVANETLANGVVDAQRAGGAAVITFTSASVNAGSGTVNITMSDGGPGKTNPHTGDITLGAVTAATLNVTNAGPDSATSQIALNGTLTISGATSVNSGGGAVNLSANLSTDVLSVTGPLNHTAGTLSVNSGSISGLYAFTSPGGLSIGNGTFTLNGGMNWSGSGTISGVNSTLSRLSIPGGDTVVISGGNHSLSSITYSNAGTTQIDLLAGNSLSVPLGAVIENQFGGLFEFVADQNSVSAGGVFSNIGGTVRNSSAGTNSISLTSGFIGSTDGSFWEASTGRLNLDAGGGAGNFNDTTNIVGDGVHFTGGTFQFFNFMPSADQINGTVNLSGATLDVRTSALTVNNTLNWTAGSIRGDTSSTSRLHIASGATAVLSGGNKSLGPNVTYSNAGTTQIDLLAGNSLSVPLGAVIENQFGGLFEFVADQNSVSAGGVFSNIGGTVRNSSAGTNSISLTSGFIGSTDGSFWEASTGRLNLDASAGAGNFVDTTNIAGNGVHFTGGTFQFSNFMPSADQINGTVNLSGATFDVQTSSLAVNGPVNLGADTTVTLNTNSIVFQNTINGAHDLAITGSGAGTITFNSTIGVTTPLQDLSITTGQALGLPQTRVTGDLSVTAGGAITQGSGSITVGGIASFDAGAGLIDLGTGTNDFQSTVNLASTGVGQPHQIWDGNDLQLGTVSFDAFSTLTIETGTNGGATGHVTQTGPITAQHVTIFTFAPLNDILLGSQANQLTDTNEPFRFNPHFTSTWRDVSLRNDSTLGTWQLNNTNTWLTIGGNLSIVTGSGIAQGSQITVAGNASFNAGANTIFLNNGLNDFQGAVNLASTGNTIHEIRDANSLDLGTVSLDQSSGRLVVQTGTAAPGLVGDVTQSGPMTGQWLNIHTFAANSEIVLDRANSMSDAANPFRLEAHGPGTWGNVSLRNTFGAGTWILNVGNTWAPITGDLTVRAVEGIAQANSISVGGEATFISQNGNVVLDQTLNDFQDVVNLTSLAPFGLAHQISDANNLALGAITVHQDSELFVQTGGAGMFGTAVTGNLTQTEPLTFSQLRVSTMSISTSDILLDQVNMLRFPGDPINLSNNNSGTWSDVSLRNDYGGSTWMLNTGNGWSPIGGDLTVRSVNGIAQQHPIRVAGTASFTSTNGAVVLDQSTNEFQGRVNLSSTAQLITNQISDGSDLRLGTISIDSSSSLLVQTGGDGTSTGNLTQAVPLAMPQLRVQTFSTATSDITLDLANQMTNTTDPFWLDNLGTGTWGNVSLRNDFGAGPWMLNFTSSWDTVGGNLSIVSASSIAQSNVLSVVGTSRFETSGGPIQLTHNNDFQDTVTLVGGTNVSVFQSFLHDLKVAPLTAQQLTLSSGAGIDLSAGTYAASVGALSLSAIAPIELTSGTVTFSGANGISILGAVAGPGALVMNQTNPTTGNITVNGSLGTFGSRLGGLTIHEANSVGVQLGTTTGFVNGDLDVTSPARIEMGSLAVSGTSHFQANNHIVQLDGNNDFVGVVTVLGGSVTSINQNSVNPLRVAPLTTDRLRIQSQQSNVALTAGTYQAAFDTLEIAALGGNSITLGAGTVTLDAASGLTLAGNVEGPGALVINQQGLGASLSVGGTLGTSGARLAGLTIDNASTTGVQLSGSGAFVAGDLDITSAGEIRLGTSAVTGTSRFEAGNAPAVINGDNDFVGLVTMTGSNEVWIAQNSLNPLRVAPLSADFMFFDSRQSNVQLSAGTYAATAGNIRIDTGFPNSIALGAGTVTLDAQNGVQLNGSVAGPGALSIHQRSAGGLIGVVGSLGTSAARLGGLTIDDQSTLGLSLGTTGAFVTGDLDVTAASQMQFGPLAVSGTSQFRFQPGVHAGVNIFDTGNDFGGVVTVVDPTFLLLAHSGPGPLRVAPLTAEQMTIVSWQSDVQLAAGTYQSTVGSLDIGVLGGDAITLSAGTVTLDAANGVSMGGGDVHGPGGLVIHQRDASGYLLSESLGTPGSRLASLAIHNASTNNLSLNDVNATGAVSVETAGDLTLPIGTVVSSSASDVVLAGANFVNNAGSGALSAGGRWLVYSNSPAGSTEGGLAGAGVRLYNRTYAADPPASIAAGDHLVYVAQPTLAVSANNQSRSYGDANPAFTLSLAGLVSDDGYTDTASDALLTGAATTTATATSPVSGSPYAITQGTVASGAGYALTFTDGQLTVSPRPITVTADAGQTKVYGNVDPTLGFSITTGNLIGADTLSGALARAAGENVGAYAINQGTLANPNYGITFTGSNFGITQRPIGVTADAGQAKTYGSADPGLTYSITSGSLVGADTLSGAPARAAGENVGAYAINQGTLANANYGITFASNSFGVLPAPLTVTADNASRPEGQPNPPFSASYSGFLLGDTAASLGGALGYATPATALSAAGNYPVTPFGVTSANYAITFVDGVLTVTPAAVTPPVPVVVLEAGRAYLDTLSGIQASRIAAPLPVEYDRMVTIENGGIRLPEGLKP